MIQRLSQLKSDLEYDGPAVYITSLALGLKMMQLSFGFILVRLCIFTDESNNIII